MEKGLCKQNAFAHMKGQKISKDIFHLVTSSKTELKIVPDRTSINERLISHNLIFISAVICFVPNLTFVYATNFVCT